MKLSLEYIAGFFDGEGCVALSSDKSSIRVTIKQVDPRNLVVLKKMFGGSLLKTKKRAKNVHWRQSWHWILVGLKAEDFLQVIIPYLTNKKEQAELALQLRKSLSPKTQYRLSKDQIDFREKLDSRIRLLKRKEVNTL